LDGDWQTFLKSRNRKFRENLRRIDRKISKLDDIRFEQHYRPEEIEKSMDIAYEIQQKSHKTEYRKTIFGDEDARQFYRDLSRALSERGWLMLSLLKMRGQPIAYDFSFLMNDSFYGCYSAYDERYSELSPGIFLMERILKNLFQTGVKEADLYRGGEHYKRKWTQLTKQQMRLRVFKRGSLYAKMFSILVPKLIPIIRKMNLCR
jgi:CelD/BcsL family acetyltransferase involved in cellulose biosynthesis